MRNLILVLSMLIGMLSYGQKAEATAYTVGFNVNNEGWGEFTECSVPITFDFDNSRIVFRANERIVLRITGGEVINPDGNGEIAIFRCVDPDNLDCEVWLTQPDEMGMSGLFVFYKGITIGYQIILQK